MNLAHLYVHVPFCVRRCGYCDFAVTATAAAPVAEWLAAVRAELAHRCSAGEWSGRMQLDTIYIGGGTPSLLGAGAMRRLRDVLAEFADWDDATVEWTAEANPESFTPALAEDWIASGINRLSLGVQTFHEPALRWMGRLHGAGGAESAIAAARNAGLGNISIDLIFGLPARLGRDWSADLDRTLALEPAHVSLYGLTAEPDTPLGSRVSAGREQLADEDCYAAEYLLAARRLSAAGLCHYEVSNFARPGRASRHNRAYWQLRPYAGVGPGAHSYLPPFRSWNVRDWRAYRDGLRAGTGAEAGREEVGGNDSELERLWLGLRNRDGIPLAELSEAQRRLVSRWRSAGLADEGAVVRLTAHGWLVLDRLAVELDARRG